MKACLIHQTPNYSVHWKIHPSKGRSEAFVHYDHEESYYLEKDSFAQLNCLRTTHDHIIIRQAKQSKQNDMITDGLRRVGFIGKLEYLQIPGVSPLDCLIVTR